MPSDFLFKTFFGNSVLSYALAAASLAGGLLAVGVVKNLVLRRLKGWAEKTETTLDDFLVGAVEKIFVPLLYFGVFYLAVHSLKTNPAVAKGLHFLAALVLTVSGIRFSVELANFFLSEHWLKRESSASTQQIVRGLMPLVKGLLWALGAVFFLDNLGYKVSTVIAGLGIGGVAVALAAQAVLGDLFGYFAIMFDRPFELGDFVVVDGYMGTIEHIGIKTTRVRSLGGELLVFANSDLTGSRIRNYKKMDRRRVVFKVGVTYQTTNEQLKAAPGLIRGIVEKIPGTLFDRAHFQAFGDSSLDVEVAYYVLSADYNRYMDIQQEINLALKEAFEQRGIGFAYPTRTLHLQQASAS